MSSTPTYGLPYPALTDPPNGAAQMQDLAEGVEGELSRIDTDTANLDTRVTDLQDRHPRFHFGTWTNGGGSVDIPSGTSGNTVLATIPIPDPGGSYRLRVFFAEPIEWDTSGFGYLRIRLDSATGTMLAEFDYSSLPNGWTNVSAPGAMYDTLLSGGDTVYVTFGSSSPATARAVRRFVYAEVIPA